MIPILVSFGPLHLYSYGFSIAVGIFLALAVIARRYAKDDFLSSEETVDLLLSGGLAGFLGARMYYVFQYWHEYREFWPKIFAVWEGGLIFYGGVPAALLGLVLWLRAKKKSVLRGIDRVTPYVAMIQAFGRVGCFLNGCCFGTPCDLPWKVSFPGGPAGVHPAQLYESLAMLMISGILFRYEGKKNPAGMTLALYFMLYGIARFEIERVRETAFIALGLSWNQWISLGILFAGGVLGVLIKMRERRTIRGN